MVTNQNRKLIETDNIEKLNTKKRKTQITKQPESYLSLSRLAAFTKDNKN